MSFVPLILALCASASVASTKPAKKAAPVAPRVSAPVVTRDNFVSLTLVKTTVTAGFDARGEHDSTDMSWEIRVQNNSISNISGSTFSSFGGGYGGKFSSMPRMEEHVKASPRALQPYRRLTAPLSNNQLDLLLRAISETRLPALAGKYEDKYLRDGESQVLTLTISDEANRDRTFTIENRGDTAPRAYYDFTARLRAFVALKFPSQPTPAPTPAAPIPAQPAPVE